METIMNLIKDYYGIIYGLLGLLIAFLGLVVAIKSHNIAKICNEREEINQRRKYEREERIRREREARAKRNLREIVNKKQKELKNIERATEYASYLTPFGEVADIITFRKRAKLESDINRLKKLL